MIWTKEYIQNFLDYIASEAKESFNRGNMVVNGIENRRIVYRMLVQMLERQTIDERTTESTHHTNGRGFNASDARVLTSIAKRSQPYKNLTPKQAKLVASKLKKYSGQLAEIAIEVSASRANMRAA